MSPRRPHALTLVQLLSVVARAPEMWQTHMAVPQKPVVRFKNRLHRSQRTTAPPPLTVSLLALLGLLYCDVADAAALPGALTVSVAACTQGATGECPFVGVSSSSVGLDALFTNFKVRSDQMLSDACCGSFTFSHSLIAESAMCIRCGASMSCFMPSALLSSADHPHRLCPAASRHHRVTGRRSHRDRQRR